MYKAIIFDFGGIIYQHPKEVIPEVLARIYNQPIEITIREYGKYKDTDPEENITYSKLKKLAKIASAYLRLKNLENENYRFDAISVWINSETGESKIKHIPNL